MVIKTKKADIMVIFREFCKYPRTHRCKYPELYSNDWKAKNETVSDLEFAKFVDEYYQDKIKGTPFHHNLKYLTLENAINALDTEGHYLGFLQELNTAQIECFFGLLSHTELALIYQAKHAEPIREKHLSLDVILKAIDIVKKCDTNKTDDFKTCLDVLGGVASTLQNKHYTERQAYQDFFYRMHNFIFTGDATKYKTLKITNGILQHYFNLKQDYFTKQTNFDNYISIHYIYETMDGILLFHSQTKPSKQ